jgi:hypothetical protein
MSKKATTAVTKKTTFSNEPSGGSGDNDVKNKIK